MTISMTWPQYRRRQCTHNGKVVSLSPSECEIMSVLLMRKGLCTTVSDLIEALYPNPDIEPDTANTCVKVFVKLLRRKLPDAIFTNARRGYMVGAPQ